MPRWSKLSKVTNKREKYKMKARFYFYFRDGVSSAKQSNKFTHRLHRFTQIFSKN